jgi:hypothetical protein
MKKELIEHDANGPFLRSHNATNAGQTEAVYAVRVKYRSGKEEFWDPQVKPHTNESVNKTRDTVYRFVNRDMKQNQVASVEAVSRTVTITATDWEEDRGQEA